MRIFVIDEDFKKKSGHYYQYNKALIEIFQGNTIEIFANRFIDREIVAEIPEITPYFSGFKRVVHIKVLGGLINAILFWFTFYRQLSSLFKKNKGNDIFYFFEMVSFNNIIPVGLAVLRHNVRAGLLYRIGMNDFLGYPKKLHKTLNRIQAYLINRMIKRKVSFYTDSEIIQAEFNTAFNSPMTVLPIPNLDIFMSDNENKEQGFYCYLPGMVRKDKGVDFLLDTLERIETEHSFSLKDFIFITQYQANYETEYCNRLQSRFSALPSKAVFLGDLSSEEFNHWFSLSNLIIITYDTNCGYGSRTSGILSDTINFAKPFITSKNTWMSAQSARYNTGACVTYGDTTGFAAALNDMVVNYSAYMEKAKLAKAAWHQFHSKENYYNIFVQSIS